MRVRVPLVLGLALIGVAATACGPASPEPSAGGSPSDVAVATGTPETSPEFSFPLFTTGAAPELEALIPDVIGGLPMQKFSVTGADFLSGATPEQMAQFLADLGVTIDDISAAFGFGGTPEGASASMVVFRAAGASGDRLVEVFIERSNEDRETPLVWTATTVGGKSGTLTKACPTSADLGTWPKKRESAESSRLSPIIQ